MAEQNLTDAKLAAEIRKINAEAEAAELDLALKRVELAQAELEHQQDAREEAEVAAADFHHRVYRFHESVSGTSAKNAILTLAKWGRLASPGDTIEIVYCSPGGSVLDGLALGAEIMRLHNAGLHVVTRVEGYSASMAGILVQFGTERVIAADSYLHLHEVSTGAIGKASDLEDTAELAKRLTRQACEIYARRSGLMTAKEIHNRIKRQEWWLDATQALELGFVDRVD